MDAYASYLIGFESLICEEHAVLQNRKLIARACFHQLVHSVWSYHDMISLPWRSRARALDIASRFLSKHVVYCFPGKPISILNKDRRLYRASAISGSWSSVLQTVIHQGQFSTDSGWL